MKYDYKVSKMIRGDIDQALRVWNEQYKLYCNNKAFPAYWKMNTGEIENLLKNKIDNQSIIVAKEDDNVVGFLAYDEFCFNGENSVYCPVSGHAAVEECKESIYLCMYKSISQQWVNKSIFNHLWTIFFNDSKLKNLLFDLGYGSHLINAFSNLNIPSDNGSIYEIRKANPENTDILYDLIRESDMYYRSAPIFMKRYGVSKENVLEIITKSIVFIAWEKETAVGFINLNVSEINDTETLHTKNNGLIDEIGAYIKAEYRGKGIGNQLLKSISDYCKLNNISTVHVDFETSNPFANKFWRKYFDPMLLSMRRTINKNINEA